METKKEILILVHGRGGSAEDILSLAGYLNVKDYALIAPQCSRQHLVSLFFPGTGCRE